MQKNVDYVVEDVRDGYLIVEGGKKITFPLPLQSMQPAWARTYAIVQGTEFYENETARMWDTRNAHFTLKTRYVGVPRCKSSAQLHVT